MIRAGLTLVGIAVVAAWIGDQQRRNIELALTYARARAQAAQQMTELLAWAQQHD